MKRSAFPLLSGLLTLFLLTAQPVASQTTPTVMDIYNKIDDAFRQKQFVQACDLYKKFFAIKHGVVSWDYFRAAQACAGAGSIDEAFAYLDKMMLLGWQYDAVLEQDANMKRLHSDMRWASLIKRIQAIQIESAQHLDPTRAGLANNPALSQVDDWLKDPKIDAATLYARLTAWNQYQVPKETGQFLRFENKISDKVSAPYFVYLPHDYDPKKPTKVLIWLRGGIGAQDFPALKATDYLVENPLLGFMDEDNMIEIFPEGNSAVFWTRAIGMQNIGDQLTAVRKIVNVDDDRIFLAGFSNGASGVYAFALNDPSPFAGLFAVNGVMNESVFVPNLVSRPLVTLASEKDDYSDVAAIKRLHQAATTTGADWTLTELPGQEHYYRTYEDDAFPPLLERMKQLKRNPLRPHIDWETVDTNAGRCDWVQIDALNTTAPRASWHTPPTKPLYALERNGRVETRTVADDSGAIRADYAGNRFVVQTSRVKHLTLWLHPGMVDFTHPIEVVVNGKSLFHKKVDMDKAVIAEQFTKHFDRTQLFVAKISLEVPR